MQAQVVPDTQEAATYCHIVVLVQSWLQHSLNLAICFVAIADH